MLLAATGKYLINPDQVRKYRECGSGIGADGVIKKDYIQHFGQSGDMEPKKFWAWLKQLGLGHTTTSQGHYKITHQNGTTFANVALSHGKGRKGYFNNETITKFRMALRKAGLPDIRPR
jgi:hypothetical protein